jgi:voltage-gated potassium channel
MLVVALLTIPALVLEEASLGAPWHGVALALNWLIWSAFLAEAITMVSVVDRPSGWVRDHPLEVAILVLTPPFLPASLQAARVFRLLRVLRLLRAAVLARRLLSTEGVRDAAVLAFVTVIAGGAAFAAIEKSQHLSSWDGVWWAITTVTTVGYGDVVPHTTGGRVLGIVVMLVGIGFVAILTAAAASRFMRQHEQEATIERDLRERLDEVLRRLEAMESRVGDASRGR